jgi:hypothetical protein
VQRRTVLFLTPILVIVFALAAESSRMPQSPSASGQQLDSAVRFAFGGNAAEIPPEFSGNLVFLPVRVNQSQPSSFLLDSNAPKTSIDPKRAAELLRPDAAAAEGSAPPPVSAIQNAILGLPGIQFPLASLDAISDQQFSAQNGKVYQGTLANDFFSRVVLEIDYSRQTVRVFDPGTYNYSGSGTSFPITFSGKYPLIRAKFSLPGEKTVEGEFNVDTALDEGIVISDRFATPHRLFSSRMKTIPDVSPRAEGNAKAVVGRTKSFSIGKYDADQLIASFSQSGGIDSADSRIAGSLGGAFWKRFTVVFDFPHQRLILKPNTRFSDFDEADMSGLSIIAKGPGLKVFEIVRVSPNSPGSEAGFQQGDIIEGINDEAAADLNLVAIRDLFRQVGHTDKLLIDRKGQSITLSLKLRRLV